METFSYNTNNNQYSSKGWLTGFWSAFCLTFFLLLMCAVVYPLFVLAIAQITPDKGKGEKTTDKAGKEYYANIGQKFDADTYFHSRRPSAVNYNAAGSGGSNKGANNPEYLKEVQQRVNEFMAKNPGAAIPVDMVTASGSGLDPNISVMAAQVQISRIAKARNLDIAQIRQLVNENIEKEFFGPEKINVLKLNIDLDKMK